MKFKRKIIAVFLSFLMFNGFFPAVETGGIFSNETSETKITSILKNEMEDAEEPLSVVVWYHNLEESTIEQMVKDRIGFCANDLEADYSSPSKELIDALDKAAAAINVGEAKSIDDLGNAKLVCNTLQMLLVAVNTNQFNTIYLRMFLKTLHCINNYWFITNIKKLFRYILSHSISNSTCYN